MSEMVEIEIDSKLKEDVEKILSPLGLDIKKGN